ncbi:methyltransferase [Dyella sp. M7H15-1]|uniref:class I SAM-dependent methyltransferase n=1 Tax=Dyella sp. M7H15-1 TaxID=2501295 RepID=UPI001004D6A9|nr:class I SAM-dependent methyltransferase [Dyella sp. M7H15-1]QAU24455.1 methyltransferase [Dyella sp. M7H15-1]
MKIRFAFALSTALLLAGSVHAQHAWQDQPTGDLVPPTRASDFTASQLDAVLAGSWRSATNKARDIYRHPKATLRFFGLQPDQTVIEITPGGGWYSEILAPLLHDNGHYIAAVPGGDGSEQRQDAATLRTKFGADATEYGKASIVTYNPKAPVFGAPGSADMVLTFRNVHNWAMAGTASAMFKAFYAVLKPGGTLGVVDHRAAEDARFDTVKNSGYLPTDYVIKLATDAGFKLDAQSDINANAKDTKDYPKGVWTLPPRLTLGVQDRAKYLAIGESDRMTLRFVKVAKAPASISSAPAKPTAD